MDGGNRTIARSVASTSGPLGLWVMLGGMRIIGGKYRGRKLARPGDDIRPTTDRLRESLFNVLGPRVEGSVWLDLFAGSGAMGIEALSRGASLVVFNDRGFEAVRLIEKNLRLCGIERGFEIHQKDALTLLNQLRGRSFDFVILDPPYAYPRHGKLLEKIGETLAGSPAVLLEVFKKTDLSFLPAGWHLSRTIQAGDSHLLMLDFEAAE